MTAREMYESRFARHLATVALTAIVALIASPAPAASVDSTLFNATSNTGGDDPAGQGQNFAFSSSIGGDTPEDAFGNNDGGIEPTTFIFADGRTPDNGNFEMGDGGESVDVISWTTDTSQFVILDGFRLDVASDGGDPARGTQLVLFNVQGEQDHLFDNDGASGPTDQLFSVAQVGNNFALSLTHSTAQGARIHEIDAITTDTSAAVVNETIFNAASNTGGDDPAGLAFNFAHSPLVNGSETIEDAFGNNDGGVESTTLLFADGGLIDNGNNTFDAGTETIDFIEWSTTEQILLGGYRVVLEGDGAVEGAPRSTELVRFFVNGQLRDVIDINGFTGTFDRLFASGPVLGIEFRIELTRATNGGVNGGPRLVEIDALNAEAIPAPVALPAGLALMGLALARRRRRTH